MEHLSPEDIAAIKKEIFASLHCALPGIVENFDAGTQTAEVRPAVKRSLQSHPERCEGSPRRSDIPFPLLHDVPVFMPVPFEVRPGDACLLVFADCDIDAWLETGNIEKTASERMHSLSDAFAFVGFRA